MLRGISFIASYIELYPALHYIFISLHIHIPSISIFMSLGVHSGNRIAYEDLPSRNYLSPICSNKIQYTSDIVDSQM